VATAALNKKALQRLHEQRLIIADAKRGLAHADEELSDGDNGIIEWYQNVLEGRVSLLDKGPSESEGTDFLTAKLSHIALQKIRALAKAEMQWFKQESGLQDRIFRLKNKAVTEEGMRVTKEGQKTSRENMLKDAKKEVTATANAIKEEKLSNAKTVYGLQVALYDNKMSCGMLAQLIYKRGEQSDCADALPKIKRFVNKTDEQYVHTPKPKYTNPLLLQADADDEQTDESEDFAGFLQTHKQKLAKCIWKRKAMDVSKAAEKLYEQETSPDSEVGQELIDMEKDDESPFDEQMASFLQTKIRGWPMNVIDSYKLVCQAGYKQPCLDFWRELKPWYLEAKNEVDFLKTKIQAQEETSRRLVERLQHTFDAAEFKRTEMEVSVGKLTNQISQHQSAENRFTAARGTLEGQLALGLDKWKKEKNATEIVISSIQCLKLGIVKMAGYKKEKWPVDCIVSKNWQPAPSGGCTKDCDDGTGAGTMDWIKTVDQNASNLGTACPKVLKRTATCNRQACPVSCLLEKWGGYSECSKLCGGGNRFRTREVKRYPKGTGAPCDVTEQTEQCNNNVCERWVKNPNTMPVSPGGGDYWFGGGNFIMQGWGTQKRIAEYYDKAELALHDKTWQPDGFSNVNKLYVAKPILGCGSLVKYGGSGDVDVSKLTSWVSQKGWEQLVTAKTCDVVNRTINVFGGKNVTVKTRDNCKPAADWSKMWTKGKKMMKVQCPDGYYINRIHINNGRVLDSDPGSKTSKPFQYNKIDKLTCVKRPSGQTKWGAADNVVKDWKNSKVWKESDFKCRGRGKYFLTGWIGDWRCQADHGLQCITTLLCNEMTFSKPTDCKKKSKKGL
jgi:hypothetical protein